MIYSLRSIYLTVIFGFLLFLFGFWFQVFYIHSHETFTFLQSNPWQQQIISSPVYRVKLLSSQRLTESVQSPSGLIEVIEESSDSSEASIQSPSDMIKAKQASESGSEASVQSPSDMIVAKQESESGSEASVQSPSDMIKAKQESESGSEASVQSPSDMIAAKESIPSSSQVDFVTIPDLHNKLRDQSLHSFSVYEAVKSTNFPPNPGPIVHFLSQPGNHIPIVLLTCNRPELLTETLTSLLQVKGLSKANILISQDGALPEIKAIAVKNDIQIHQNTLRPSLRGDESTPIALHYKYSLDKAFEIFPQAPAVIIVEDDLLFSPDFLQYMEAVGPILDVDASVMAVSAWNDNGFKGHVADSYELYRTNFFPGLGWLLSKALYVNELRERWPSKHWDHWLRSPDIHRGREIVYPEVLYFTCHVHLAHYVTICLPILILYICIDPALIS